MSLLFVDTMTWTITLLGWGIVFMALVFLIFVFSLVPKLLQLDIKKMFAKKEGTANVEVNDSAHELSGETNAAIAMALYAYFNEQHDEESNVITIKSVRKRYSPWSSKVYGFNNVNLGR